MGKNSTRIFHELIQVIRYIKSILLLSLLKGKPCQCPYNGARLQFASPGQVCLAGSCMVPCVTGIMLNLSWCKVPGVFRSNSVTAVLQLSNLGSNMFGHVRLTHVPPIFFNWVTIAKLCIDCSAIRTCYKRHQYRTLGHGGLKIPRQVIK